MSFLITTTGTLGTVVLDDMGARTFVHPTVAFDLNVEYALEEIRDSKDLGNMLDLGHITATFGALSITSTAQLQSIVTAHVHDASDIVAGILPVTRGGSGSNVFTPLELLRMNVGGTAFETITGVTLASLARVDAPSTYGAFMQTFQSNNVSIVDVATTGLVTLEAASNGANSVIMTIPGSTVSDTFVLENFAQTLTNKNIDGATNTFSNIGDSAIAPHTSTKITITNKAQLNNQIAYKDQNNTFGAFDQIFQNLRLKIVDNSATNRYIIQTSTLTADRNAILPVLSANDTFVFETVAQTLTNKTVNLTNNTMTETGAVLGGILKHNGTKYANVPMGFANSMLAVNNTGTDILWITPQVASLYVNNTGTLTTTSTTLSTNIMTGMVLTVVVAGNYLCDFSGMAFNSAIAQVEIEIWRQPFFGTAAAYAGTLRTWGNSAPSQRGLIGHSGVRLTLNILDTITIRWRVTAGTGSIQTPTFTLIKTT